LALRQKSARRAASEAHTLPLGAEATIHNVRYTLIGVVHKTEIGEDSGWTEYLLYAPQEGFAWLTETDDGEWSFAQTLNEWPLLDRGGNPLDKRKLYDYQSRVESAAGAFYWHIQPGDTLQHRDYGRDDDKLCAEQSAQELSWSRNLSVTPEQIEKWFGRKIATAGGAGSSGVGSRRGQGRNRASPMRVRPQKPGGQAKSHMTARLKAKSSTPVKAMMAMMKTTTTVK